MCDSSELALPEIEEIPFPAPTSGSLTLVEDGRVWRDRVRKFIAV
jgi:hypothetical protein